MLRCLLVATVLAALAAGCAAPPADAERGDGTVQVVATVYPLAWLAGEVIDGADVVALSAAGQDPHDMELTPQQRGQLEDADLVVSMGAIDFQPQIEAAVAQRSGETVSVAEVAGPDRLRPLAADEDGAVDPHVWFDAAVMADVARAVGEAAAAVDTGRAEQHRRQADRVAQTLDRLAGDVAAVLGSCRHDTVVVGHEAYGYLTEPHGIEQIGISGASGHGDASPADIARLAAHVEAEQLPAVLSEPVEGRTAAAAVAAEAGVEVIDILSLDVVDAEQAARGYPELLLEQVEAVAAAAECTA